MYKKNRWLTISLLCMSLLLVACSSKTTITLYEDEEWVVENVSEVDASLLPQISMGADIFPGLGLDVGFDMDAWSELLMGRSMDELTPYYRDLGIAFFWRTRSVGEEKTVYTLRWEGQGWNTLQTVVLTGTNASLVNLGGNQVRFAMSMPVDELGLSLLTDNVIEVQGRQIIQSNAHQVRGGNATWHNPHTQMDATVALGPKSNMTTALTVVGVVLGGSVVITIVVLVIRSMSIPSRGARRLPHPARRPSRRTPKKYPRRYR